MCVIRKVQNSFTQAVRRLTSEPELKSRDFSKVEKRIKNTTLKGTEKNKI